MLRYAKNEPVEGGHNLYLIRGHCCKLIDSPNTLITLLRRSLFEGSEREELDEDPGLVTLAIFYKPSILYQVTNKINYPGNGYYSSNDVANK